MAFQKDTLHLALAVTGSIASYKALELCRLFVEQNVEVTPLLSHSAKRFVTAESFSVLCGRQAIEDLWQNGQQGILHVQLAKKIQGLLIAPATADVISRLAAGRADDVITALALSHQGPVLIAPAMESQMWQHLATKRNVEILRSYGYHILEPEKGSLASGAFGIGRLANSQRIVLQMLRLMGSQDLCHEHILVSAGPSREFIDPSRFISNSASGKMGIALAKQAYLRGAKVVLILGPHEQEVPVDISVVNVVSTADFQKAIVHALSDCSMLLMAAAPVDFKPKEVFSQKIKKEQITQQSSLSLEKNPDILKNITKQTLAKNVLRLGFAAESENFLAHAQEKLLEKNLDFIFVNPIGQLADTSAQSRQPSFPTAFHGDDNMGWLLSHQHPPVFFDKQKKDLLANKLLDALLQQRCYMTDQVKGC